MRIKIDSLEFMYNFLQSSPSRESTETWQQEEPKNVFAPFAYPSASLDPPLEDISVSFKRFGDNYSVIVPIDARDPTVFSRTRDAFQKALDHLGYKFRPLYNPGGRIMDTSVGRIKKNGNNDFSIVPVNNNKMRILAMGSWGAYTRTFPDNPDTFIKEVGTLEGVVNVLLGCLLPPSTADHGRDSDEEILYLNP